MQPNLLNPDLHLPGSADLPCSDDTPVDNENQNKLPNWLLAVLEEIWSERQDWFFGVDMAIYDREGQHCRTPTVIPDGFLSLGVERHKRGELGRLSYVLQEENEVAPILVLEMVSKTYGDEYGQKLRKYEQLGVKYYLVYNREYSQRDQHQPFEVYRLERGIYQLQQGEPYWMPEVGLGIGRVRGEQSGIEREWLAWHDKVGTAYPLPSELLQRERLRADQERLRADQERLRADQLDQALQQAQQQAEQERREKLKLLAKLKQLGVEPD